MARDAEDKEASAWCARRLLRAIPVCDLHAVSSASQVFANFFCDHDRSVLSTGTAECNCQIALAFMYVVRQQVNKQIRDASNKFLCLRKGTYVLRNSGM